MKLSNKASKTSGFVISLEFLLVLALVVFPLMVGLILLGRKLVTLYLNHLEVIEQPLSRPVIWDSTAATPPTTNPKVVGAVVGYDRFGAPLVLYRHHTGTFPVIANQEFIPGVLLGVRPNRFTTVSAVYYDNVNCTGTAYVRSELASVTIPNVGYLGQLQGVNYAVGNGNILYRSPLPSVAGATVGISTFWVSQDITDQSPASGGSACFSAGIELTALTRNQSNAAGIATATASTARDHYLRDGDAVTISNADAAFFNVTATVTVIGPRAFRYTVDTGVAAVSGGTTTYPLNAGQFISATPSTITQLVAASTVADLDNAAPGAANNFVPPFRVVFPTAVTGPTPVPSGG